VFVLSRAELLGKGWYNAAAPNTQSAKLVADLEPEAPVPQHFPQCPGEFQLARQSPSTYSQPSEHEISLDAKGLKTKNLIC